MKKVNVAYLRVSTEAQTEKYGLDVQKDKISVLAQKKGAVISRWYVDGGYSGSNINRPEMQRLLDDAKKGEIASVFVYKLDRMSRDAIDTLTLLYRVLPEYGVKIESATEELHFDTPMDKVMIGVNAIMGQYEREVIYMRTRAGMVERVKKGLWMGGGCIPYGYYYDRNDGILHEKPEEAEKVREIYKMYIEGFSCEKIAQTFGMCSDMLVRKILKRKLYLGLIEYNGKIYQGKHRPIIDEETYYKAQECMKKRSNSAFIINNFMLSGLCYCGKCGARMRYQKWGKYHALVCYSRYKSSHSYMIKKDGCDNKTVKADYVEAEVNDCFKRFAVNISKKENVKTRSKFFESEIRKTNERLKKFYLLYAENDSAALWELISDEEKKLKLLEDRLEEERSKEKNNANEKIEKISKISDVWDSLLPKEKNKILKECVEKIIIDDDDITIHFNII